MNLKTALFAVVTMGLLGSLTAGTGCAKNKCEQAADDQIDKYEDCGFELADGSDGDTEAECTEEAGNLAEAVAKCITDAPCGALDGSDAEAAAELGMCQLDAIASAAS